MMQSVQKQKLWLIPVAAFVTLQLIFVLLVDPVEYDEAIYMNIARQLRRTGLALRPMGETGFLHADHTTLYQHLMGALSFLIGDNVFLIRLITSFTGLATVLTVGTVVKHAGSGIISATIAATFLATSGFFQNYAWFVREETPMCLAICLSVWFLWQEENSGKARYMWFAGFWAAIAVLFKEFALIYCLAMGVYTLLVTKNRWRNSVYVAIPPTVALFGWLLWIWSIDPPRAQATLMRWIDSSGGSGLDFRFNIGLQDWVTQVGIHIVGAGLILFVLSAISLGTTQKRKLPRLVWLTGGYSLLAIGISLVISLKEPRHIIATIPLLAITGGLSADWDKFLAKIGWKALPLFGVLLFSQSPFQLPSDAAARTRERVVKPLIANRMFHEGRYYGVLAGVGSRINELTEPEDVVLVLHHGPVVSWYADRHYQMVYTQPLVKVLALIDSAEWLVYDQEAFLQLSDTEVEQVRQIIAKNFALVETVNDEYRSVDIYQKE